MATKSREGGTKMGLIRKTLAVGTVGIVRPSSKKQRVAKKSLKQQKMANKQVAQQMQIEQEFSANPPAGWMACDQTGMLRWWDGSQWTEHYRPVGQEG